MRKKIGFIIIVFLFVGHLAHAEETDELFVVQRMVEKKWTNFNLSDVRLLEGNYFISFGNGKNVNPTKLVVYK